MTLYLYALVDRRPRRALGRGMHGRLVRVVDAGVAWAIVERGEARPPDVENILAHDRVVARIAAPAVLPLRFASTVPEVSALRSLLAPASAAIERALDLVRGAVQLTIRVRGRRAPPRRAPAGKGAGPGTRWLAERIAARSVPEIAPVTAATRPFVRAARAERHEAGALVATVYHLVARGDVRAWRAAFDRAVLRLAGVEVTATGPWPPYAFAELA